MQCRLIVSESWLIKPFMTKWIYTTMIRPVMSNACVSWVGGLKQKLCSEETHEGAEICLTNNFISFFWHH